MLNSLCPLQTAVCVLLGTEQKQLGTGNTPAGAGEGIDEILEGETSNE